MRLSVITFAVGLLCLSLSPAACEPTYSDSIKVAIDNYSYDEAPVLHSTEGSEIDSLNDINDKLFDDSALPNSNPDTAQTENFDDSQLLQLMRSAINRRISTGHYQDTESFVKHLDDIYVSLRKEPIYQAVLTEKYFAAMNEKRIVPQNIQDLLKFMKEHILKLGSVKYASEAVALSTANDLDLVVAKLITNLKTASNSPALPLLMNLQNELEDKELKILRLQSQNRRLTNVLRHSEEGNNGNQKRLFATSNGNANSYVALDKPTYIESMRESYPARRAAAIVLQIAALLALFICALACAHCFRRRYERKIQRFVNEGSQPFTAPQ